MEQSSEEKKPITDREIEEIIEHETAEEAEAEQMGRQQDAEDDKALRDEKVGEVVSDAELDL